MSSPARDIYFSNFSFSLTGDSKKYSKALQVHRPQYTAKPTFGNNNIIVPTGQTTKLTIHIVSFVLTER